MDKTGSDAAQMLEGGLPFRQIGAEDEFVDDAHDRRVTISSPRTLFDDDRYSGDDLPKNWFSWRKYVHRWVSTLALCVRVELVPNMTGSSLSLCFFPWVIFLFNKCDVSISQDQ